MSYGFEPAAGGGWGEDGGAEDGDGQFLEVVEGGIKAARAGGFLIEVW